MENGVEGEYVQVGIRRKEREEEQGEEQREGEHCGIKKKIGLMENINQNNEHHTSSMMEEGYTTEVAGPTTWALSDQ